MLLQAKTCRTNQFRYHIPSKSTNWRRAPTISHGRWTLTTTSYGRISTTTRWPCSTTTFNSTNCCSTTTINVTNRSTNCRVTITHHDDHITINANNYNCSITNVNAINNYSITNYATNYYSIFTNDATNYNVIFSNDANYSSTTNDDGRWVLITTTNDANGRRVPINYISNDANGWRLLNITHGYVNKFNGNGNANGYGYGRLWSTITKWNHYHGRW